MSERIYLGMKVPDANDLHLLLRKHCGEPGGPFDAEAAIRELIAAGWEKKFTTVWKSPKGKLFRGPALAFAIMKEYGEAA